jgi:hypothetical protein
LAGRNGTGANRLGPQQFAHNEFAARNFHGLQNFNRAGFNRNGFGNQMAWNRWGGRFWGAGWDQWGWGWGDWAGAVFWPFLWGDIFSFAFWPYDYYDPFWAYGPDFLLSSIFTAGPYFGTSYGYSPDYYGYSGLSDVYYGSYDANNLDPPQRHELEQTQAAAVQSCNGLAPGVDGLPIAQIRETVHPTGEQAADLDDLGAAEDKASQVIKASCTNEMPLTPMARLDAAEKRLNAMIQAVQIVRVPLERFYASLNDEQRHKFDAMNTSAGTSAEGRTQGGGGNLAKLCAKPAGEPANLPVQRIEQVVEPQKQQQDAFNALKQAADDAAGLLQSSCPTQMPQTQVERLDAVATRLNAMIEAMNTVRPKLQAFYNALSDEQKAKFNIMGPAPQKNASSQPG